MGWKQIKSCGGRTRTLHLKGADEITTAEEVKQALKATGQIRHKEDLIVKTLRPTRFGTQYGTIVMNRKDAEVILRQGKVKIGLNNCEIEEKIDIFKCYKCWGYGHSAAQCNGEDRSNLCQRCTGADHIRTGCNKDPYCPLCATEGHMAGEAVCGALRRATQRPSSRGLRPSTVNREQILEGAEEGG
ncbi:hypothetical protein RI129_011489 [Pyrocoelia pectoralis]|uniref:CCHC-type domain-containing protein n=1 Tax=Pyrocoelia pectoralis TaxID=417401 RepID=A0AAN7V5M3_9COLE